MLTLAPGLSQEPLHHTDQCGPLHATLLKCGVVVVDSNIIIQTVRKKVVFLVSYKKSSWKKCGKNVDRKSCFSCVEKKKFAYSLSSPLITSWLIRSSEKITCNAWNLTSDTKLRLWPNYFRRYSKHQYILNSDDQNIKSWDVL